MMETTFLYFNFSYQCISDSKIQHGDMRYNTDVRVGNALERIVDLLEDLTRMNVCLDSGALVGELVPAIDGRLSDRWSHAKRGNTR